VSAKRQWIIDQMEDSDEEVVFFEPAEVFDDAIIGLGQRPTMETVVVYDEEKILSGLAKTMPDSDDPETDAREWFDYNTASAWVGERTPIIIRVAP